jgi:serine/threonine protein kinase/tetratricopeptide (TPR) repeat protein
MIGKTISHYKILEKLGEGGMGIVYKAQDTKLDRIVALKFLPKHLLCDEEAKKRFVHEAKAASALDHQNIATIYEIDEADGECFIAMAYIEGKSIKELIKEKALSIEEILKIAIQTAGGLSKAHQKDIVHRDIKSDNIMLTPDGLAKIMDFGLAKLKGVTGLTKTGSTLGTVAYMSPEQAQGMEVDQRSDIFSFGVVLYEMITGQLPFKSEHEAAVVYSIVNETPEPLARYKANVPDGLQRIVTKALEKNREMRYQHADDLGTDLRKLKTELETGITKTLETSMKITPSIAVLPFINLSADPEQEYFCDGLAEELINALTHIKDLHVVARTSAFSFKGEKLDIREIGRKLNVETVLEGSVRKAASRLRMTAQLINVVDGYHLWAETYDRELKDIFDIQSDVAQQIAQALKATLSPEEKERIEQTPTDNLEAYDYYLQGREYAQRSIGKSDREIAIELCEKAVSADPNFAEAYASIALEHCRMYWFGWDRSPERLVKAKEAIDKALNLKPDEPLVRVANGYYYYHGFRDYARALDEFSFAVRKEPGNALYNASIGYIQRRLGKFEDALQNLKIAFQYDPRSNTRAYEVALTYRCLRMCTEAENYFDRAISLAPDIAWSYSWKAFTSIYKTGSTESARQVLHKASKRVSSDDLIWDLVYFDIYDGHYQDALDRLASIHEEVHEDQKDYTPKESIRGFIYELMGQPDEARAHYIKARTLLEKKVHERPDDARIQAELGKV